MMTSRRLRKLKLVNFKAGILKDIRLGQFVYLEEAYQSLLPLLVNSNEKYHMYHIDVFQRILGHARFIYAAFYPKQQLWRHRWRLEQLSRTG